MCVRVPWLLLHRLPVAVHSAAAAAAAAACLVRLRQSWQQQQQCSSYRWCVRLARLTACLPLAPRWPPPPPLLLQVTISLLQRAMDDSGKHKFLIDGFPRNEENRASFEAQVRVSVGAVVVRLGWRWGGGEQAC